MATKLQLITELSERTARSLTRSHANWTSFLKTAAWSYKYPFQDQLLIYAQRPDATACAPIEVWNGKLGRWVNKGAKGIALIDDSGSRYFYPGADMTRGEYMVMIANAFHLTGAGSGTFPDVPVGSPYYDAVAAAKAYDIARGDDTGLFRPEWGLTRQDAMVIIVRAFKNTGTPLTPGTIGDLAGFSDASLVSDYAVADLAALVRIGFVVGSGDRLNPKVTFSRAEAAVLLYRILIM